MNKISIVDNKIIPSIIDDVVIENNTITFSDNGEFYIEYIDSNDINLNIYIKDFINIKLYLFSNNKDIKININYYLDKKSKLTLNKFCCNNNTNEVNNIYLNGYEADVKYNFSSIGNNIDKYQINIYHNDRNTNSSIYNNTVAKERSTNIFDINSYVENGIKDCLLDQHTKIITLGDSNNKINPNMFVSENSTTAIHSSIIGNVDEESLFYLMSRGIDLKTATDLIIKGIVLFNIDATKEMENKILNLIGGE